MAQSVLLRFCQSNAPKTKKVYLNYPGCKHFSGILNKVRINSSLKSICVGIFQKERDKVCHFTSVDFIGNSWKAVWKFVFLWVVTGPETKNREV